MHPIARGPGLRLHEAVEVAQHACCRTPDVMVLAAVLVGHREPLPVYAITVEHMAPVVGGVEQKIERHLEKVGHFIRIGLEHAVRLHQRHHGRDDER